jgi:hypothetical protein
VTDIPYTALLQVGWGVVQANGNSDVIPANTTIASVDSATQVTLSNAATATALTSLKFGGTFSAPTQLFDFNPAGAGTIIPLAAGSPFDLSTTGAYTTRMVVLPTGQVLFGTGGSVAVYTPDGTASPTLRPVVNNITYNGGGKFTLTGRQLDGQSAGADYGDDVQMDSNYPILRLVNSAGKVFYCRSTNWSAGAVGTGPVIQTVNFTLPSGITAGNYSAIVSGAGISSVPVGIVITQAEVNGQ